MKTVVLHQVLELSFLSDTDYANPLWDVQIQLHLQGPSGQSAVYDCYWDGGRDFKARVSLDENGCWAWQTTCSDVTNAGLIQQGQVQCEPYVGENPLYLHGPIQVSETGTHFQHADGTPFFWLGDTAWNGVIRGDDRDWQTYLQTRAKQKFTVIQCVLPHWRGDAEDELGHTACSEQHPIAVNPAYFQEKDRRFAMINEQGLLAAPVILWSHLPTDLGYKLSQEDAIALARYIVARYGAYQLAWLLGGDGYYQKMGIDRWKHIGRRVFAERHDRPVTLHPAGLRWPNKFFGNENWLDFIGYQSGHGDVPEDIQWLAKGPDPQVTSTHPVKPVINLEPNYEGAIGYHNKVLFTDEHVRRAAYWSCMNVPTAGVTYGHDAIWNWNKQIGPSEGHGDWGGGAIAPWKTALQTDGITSMSIMKTFFESIDWSTLQPAEHLLAAQPGDIDPSHHVTVSRTADGKCIVVYTPVGCTLDIQTQGYEMQWFNPRNGQYASASDTCTPDEKDWVLLLKHVD